MPSGLWKGYKRKPDTGSGQTSSIVVGKAPVAVPSSNDESQSTTNTAGEASESSSTEIPFLGLKLLVEGNSPVVDIVAIHGLNGSCETTWMAKNNVKWLQDDKMLPAKIPNARIFSWGYDARTHSTKPLTAMYLYDHAQTLVSDLSLERRLTKTERRPIIFIAHSLGGIVLKSAFIHSSMANSGHLKDHKAIKTSTYGIIYMGTPHQGGEGVPWGQRLVNVGSIFMHTNDNLIQILAKDSETLQNQLAQYVSISSSFVTKFACETYPMQIRTLGEILIVPKSSAVVPGAVDTEAIAIMANHQEMVKYTSENDPGFKKISGHLMLMVEEAQGKVSRNWEQEVALQNAMFGMLNPDFHVPFDLTGIPITGSFVGRESYLDMMVHYLSPTLAARRRKVCVLHGLGGIGKTQLALEYARLHRSEYSSISWIDGKTEETPIQDLVSIAARIPETHRPAFSVDAIQDPWDPKRKAMEVLRWFGLAGNSSWLLIYDNVDKTSYGASDTDAELQASYNIEEYLPPIDAGAIIITSRLQRLSKLGEQIHLKKIDTTSGVAILEKQSGVCFRYTSFHECGSRGSSGTEAIDPDALTLVERLDGLPLALVIAGSYLSRTTIPKYLEFYNTFWNTLHESLSFSPDYPGRTIITTWRISFDEVKRKDQRAARLLQLWGYLDNRDIWYELFNQSGRTPLAPDWFCQIMSTEFAFLDAINVLLDYSLVEKNEGQSSYSMHAVVHDWIRETVNRDDDGMFLKWTVGTVGVLVRWTAGRAIQDEKYCQAMQSRILPHAARIVQNLSGRAVPPSDPVEPDSRFGGYFLDGLRYIGDFFYECCLFTEAELIFQRLISELEVADSAESSLIFCILQKLGDVHIHQGKCRQAEIVFPRALAGQERRLGLDNEQTLMLINNLAELFQKQGKSSERERLHERAVAGKEEFCARDDHSITEIDTLSALGLIYSSQGRFADAEYTEKKALAGYEKFRGKGDWYTLFQASSLAFVYESQGKFEDAEVICQRILTSRESLYGHEHILTIDALKWLGRLYKIMARYDEAERTLWYVLKQQEVLLTKNHKVVLDTLAELGHVFLVQEKYAEAEPIYQRAVYAAEKTLGYEHADTLMSVHCLGDIYMNLGKLSDSEIAYKRVLTAREKIFHEEHEMILVLIHDLGVLYAAQGKEADAEKLLYRAWTTRDKVLGTEHEKTDESAIAIYELWLSQGVYAKRKKAKFSRISLPVLPNWFFGRRLNCGSHSDRYSYNAIRTI